ALDGGLLVDFDAAAVGPAGQAPGHRVVPGDRPRRVVQGAADRRQVAAAGQVQLGNALLDEGGVDDFAVDAQVLIDFRPPALRAQGRLGVGQGEVAALGVKEVQAQVARQVAEEVHAGLVELRAFGREVVGADDGSVAAGAAAADVAFFQDRDVGDAVVLGQVVRRRQAVPAAADDDDVVFTLEAIWGAEHPRLGILLAEREAEQTPRHTGYSPDRPGIQLVPASGTPAIAAASTVRATKSSRSRWWTFDLPQARARVAVSIVSTWR